MFLKPKNTTLNPRALVYKLYVDIVSTSSLQLLYKTIDNKLWVFDSENLEFIEVLGANYPTAEIVEVTQLTKLSYLTLTNERKVYAYENKKWVETDNGYSLAVKFGNIGKYQTNKYYYSGAFSYVKKGAINDSFTQPIKGNKTPLTTMSIQHFNDSINLRVGDLVVIGKKLFSVDTVEEDHKHQPHDFAIYNATLISIV